MLKKFYPYEYADSVFCIDYKKLYDNGFRAVIFDIDNTLVHHGDASNEKTDKLLRDIQALGLKTFILSDNDEERVRSFLCNNDSPYICEAGKPAKDAYIKALDILNVTADKAVYIGDQIFTDILGANRSKIPSILVKFIRLDGETNFGKRRKLESFILKHYNRNKKMKGRLGDIIIKENR